MNEDRRILFFDGHCNLCSRFIDFVVSNDKNNLFHIAPLQGKTAKVLLKPEEIRDCSSVILRESNGKKYYKSKAVFQIMESFGGGYRLLSGLRVLPGILTDKVYDIVAANRYKIFGKRLHCRLPTSEERRYFLD